jgi:diaminohydroxyphosphoribosylaminopyrimidine deaminase/5-amino-6-(5-phosphoribosylamino)uracil reductase
MLPTAPISEFDRAMMHQCIDLAKQALGCTAPNPLVGSVIVQGNKIVGTGFHPKAGEPHAEVFALRSAGEQAKGATLYVNLEPCSHHGRTPPCCNAVIQAGIQRVVVGMVDPNPQVSGSGLARLRQAGLEVVVGVEESACQTLNEAFVHRMLHKMPFGILKYAMTLDGKIATSSGHSSWVTSSAARAEVHRLRLACDAVVVGGNTVRRDNPLLTSRTQPTPLRIVMSRSLDLPVNAQLWDTTVAPTVVFTEATAPQTAQEALRQRGVEVIALERLTPAQVMAWLYDRGCLSVLWECGGTLAAQAIADGSIQKILAFIAPKIIGGVTAPTPIGELGLTQMTDALRLTKLTWHAIDTDWLVEGYLESSR